MKHFLHAKISKALLFFILSFFSFNSLVFSQNFVWAKAWGGPGYEDGRSIAVDPTNNVICAGSFSGTADFDPNAGIFNMTATGTGSDVYIVKLTSAGNLVWARRIGTGTTSETASSITTDASGNIVIVGSFYGTVDFDPGAGVYNITSSGSNDVYVLKLNSAGTFLWARSAGGAASDFPNSVDLDASGNIYCTGQMSGVADFNPSATTYTVAAYGGQDAFIFKWDLNGNFVWAASMGGTAGDQGSDVKVNNAGTSVYVSGYFSGTGAEISPFCSCGTENSAGGYDIFVVKLATTGGFQANAIMGGSLNDSGTSIDLDASDNVYLTGAFDGLSDMDPGFGVANLSGAGGFADIYVTKLTNNLGFVFAKQFSGTSSESGYEIELDPAGNIYVTGGFNDIVDFDPSPATYTVQSIGSPNSDPYVLKLDNNGNLIWVKTWGSSNGESSSDIDLDSFGNIYTTGSFFTACDMDPGAAVFNMNTIGATDAFVHKLSCTLPAPVTITQSNYTICASTATSSPLTITASSVQPVTNYGWSVVGATGVSFSPTTGTAVTMSYTSSTTFSVIATATNACGTTTSNVYKVTVNPLPPVIGVASPTAVCSGSLLTLSGSGANTYTWSSGVSNTVPFTPTASATYTVTGTDVNGCVKSNTITVNQAPNPTVTVSGTALICLNKPQTLTSSGASTYTWFPGGIVSPTITATPSVSTVYTINATSLNGCNGNGSFTVSIVQPPTPDICQVTVDSLGFNNEIYWVKTNYPSADTFIIYRETTLNNYKRIAALHKSVYSMYVDTNRATGPANGDPNLTYYKYKMQIRDSCGNLSAMSKWHETIFIQDQLNGNFNWNSYGIELSAPPISLYNVKRRMVSTGTETLIASTVGNLANDPFYASFWPLNVKWFVDAQGFNCNATAKTMVLKTKTKSNQSNDKLAMTGIGYSALSNNVHIYPNPTSDVLNIDMNGLSKTETNIEILNTLGQVVYQAKALNQHLVINTSELAGGVYIVAIKQNDKTIAIKKVVIDR